MGIVGIEISVGIGHFVTMQCLLVTSQVPPLIEGDWQRNYCRKHPLSPTATFALFCLLPLGRKLGVLAVIVRFNETSHPKKDTKCLDISVSIPNVVIKLTLLTVSSFCLSLAWVAISYTYLLHLHKVILEKCDPGLWSFNMNFVNERIPVLLV